MVCRRLWFVIIVSTALACRDEALPLGPVLKNPQLTASAPRSNGVIDRVDLGTLGGASSFATDINNAGTVAGWSLNAGGVSRAFRWTPDGGMTDLGTLPGDDWSRAISINENSDILGVSGDSESGAQTPVLWLAAAGAVALPIPLLPSASFGEPTDFNQDREVVGWDVVGLQRAWSWTEQRGKQDITASVPGGGSEGIASQINASGLVAGTSKANACSSAVLECWRAFVWNTASGYRDIGTPAGDPNVAVTGLGLNNANTVVGWTTVPGAGMRPFRWSSDGGFTMLSIESFPVYAMSINARGIASGAAWSTTAGAIQPAVWMPDGEFVPLNPGQANPGVAVAINDGGSAVGWSSSDCCGTENRATLWSIGVTGGVRFAAVTHTVAPNPEADAPGTSSRCLANVRVLVSRTALFACVARDETAK